MRSSRLRPGLMFLLCLALFAMPTGVARAAAQAAVQDTSEGTGAVNLMVPPGVADTAASKPDTGVVLGRARQPVEVSWSGRFVSLIGMLAMLGIGWLLSADRRAVPWRIIAWGIGLQLVFAVFILKTSFGESVFAAANDVVVALLGFTVQGARFLFGDLVFNNVPVGAGEVGNAPMSSTTGMVAQTGAFFAFNVLPTIIFFSSLMTVLYYLGVMQWIVKKVAWVMMRTMGTSGAETLSSAGNIFLGQTEAPLLIKPFVKTMTMSELHAVMTGGFATVAGGVMAAYVGMLLHVFPDIAGHLMAASVMSAPAGLVFAKLIFPEKGEPLTRGKLKVDVEKVDSNIIDAAARGAGEGLTLALNVGAMLLAFIALIAMLNALLGWFGNVVHLTPMLQANGWLDAGDSLSLEAILGWLLAPLAWLMGVPWKDAPVVGSLLGIKTVLNEFVGYLQLTTAIPEQGLSQRSIIIATYALCGFANFSSIAIQIGGIGGLAPDRRSDIAKLGMRAMIAGTLASFMTATIAGMLA